MKEKIVYSTYLIKKVIQEKRIFIRFPSSCKVKRGICQLCYGWNLGNGRMVEIGETIGIIAAQSIGEPGTQLTMRTFHTGGIFSGEEENSIISPTNGIIIYNTKSGKKIITKYREKAYLSYTEKKVVIRNNTFKNYIVTLPRYTLIYCHPYEKIYKKQTLAKIIQNRVKSFKKTKEKKELKTNITGQILLKNHLKKSQICILSSNIISYPLMVTNLKNQKTKLNDSVVLEKKEKIFKFYLSNLKYQKKGEGNQRTISYLIQKKILTQHKILVKKYKTEILLYIPKNTKKIGDIIFINSQFSKNILNKFNSLVVKKYNNILHVKKTTPYAIPNEYKINNRDIIKKNNIITYLNYKKQKNEDIVQGLPKVEELLEAKKTTNFQKIQNNPHDKLNYFFNKFKYNFNNQIAARKTIEKVQNFLIGRIQNVYTLQNVSISRKHIEIIVRQMTSKVIITESNNKNVLIGEIMEINKIEEYNRLQTNKVKYEPIIMGISKVNLTNESFIAEACFQETIRILTKSAMEGKIDWLHGLKENLILGSIIPAGTGLNIE